MGDVGMNDTLYKIQVMQAYEDGKEIERCHLQNVGWGEWETTINPGWMWGICDYRIKEEEEEPKETYLILIDGEIDDQCVPDEDEDSVKNTVDELNEEYPETHTYIKVREVK
jgi:hypothetical protein